MDTRLAALVERCTAVKALAVQISGPTRKQPNAYYLWCVTGPDTYRTLGDGPIFDKAEAIAIGENVAEAARLPLRLEWRD